jgi:hypothetical protein
MHFTRRAENTFMPILVAAGGAGRAVEPKKAPPKSAIVAL